MKNKNKILIKLRLIVLVLIFTALIGVTGADEYAVLNSTYTGSLFNISGWGDYNDNYLSPAIEIMGELPEAYEYELINDLYIENGSLNLSEYKRLVAN